MGFARVHDNNAAGAIEMLGAAAVVTAHPGLDDPHGIGVVPVTSVSVAYRRGAQALDPVQTVHGPKNSSAFYAFDWIAACRLHGFITFSCVRPFPADGWILDGHYFKWGAGCQYLG